MNLRPLLLASALLSGSASAQVALSGSVSDATTGPLLAGTVYHVTGTLNLAAGATLTVQPGAIVKFVTQFATFEVNGTLLCQGTSANPVIFTDIKDDAAGGDTNGDGPSTGVAGHWTYMRLYGTASASVLDHTEIRYGGAFGWGGVQLTGSNPTLRDCTLRDCQSAGLDLAANSAPIVERCHFANNGGAAVANVLFSELAGFSQCTASGNAGGDYQAIVGHGVTGNVVVQADDLIGGVGVLLGTPSISAGTTLTFGPGVVLKMKPVGVTWEISGTLSCQGTSVAPVIFTDFADDSAGGDTNDDGPSTGMPGHWTYLRFYASANASTLDHTEVRYAGYVGWSGITLTGSTPTLRDCTIRDCANAGLSLEVSSTPTVERCAFVDNGDAAVVNARFTDITGFSQCTASGNAGGDYQAIVAHGVTGNVVVQADNLIGGVGVLLGTPSIQAGTTLTLGPGVVLKMKPVGVTWEISGTLNCQGTNAAPVILTDLADDSAGGDTNDDGPSTGTPGHWTYMRFYASASASTLDYTEVRYAGYVGWSGVTLTGSTPTLRDCTIRDCANAGLSLEVSSTPTVQRCRFVDNGGAAVINARFADITGFSQCTASGNAGGDYQAIPGHGVVGDIVVQADNLIGGVAVLVNGVSVGAGNSLTLGPGVILKTAVNFVWDVTGGFATQGTTAQPVVLTTYADDAWGGDTNMDGASSGVAGGWIGLWLRGSGSATQIEHLLVRYGGANGFPCVTYYAGAGYTLSDVRIEHSATGGFDLRDHTGTARGLTAWKCAGSGISLLGGAFDLRQATVVACGTGIVRNAAWTGRVEDSIARHCTTADSSGFVVGKWRYSNGALGLAGVDGNVNIDPLFVDEVGGDFHLNAASPCIDTGDPLSPLDPDLSRADMGAYPFDSWLPVVYCTAKPNSCGLLSSISWSGSMHAGANSGFVVSANHAPGTRQGLLLYGNSGATSAPFSGGILCVQPPLKRSLLVTDTVGTLGQCDGVLSIDVATFASGAVGGHPATFLQNAGSGVWCQFWGRDPGQSDPALSNALAFVVQP